MATLKNLTVNDTGYLQLPTGNTASRPASPAVGMVRFNTDIGGVEVYTTGGWISADEKQSATSSGTITTTGGYTIHTFTTTGAHTFTPAYTGPIDVLVIGGGGSGAAGIGGGGGAGGFIFNQGVLVTGGTTYPLSVGTGGGATGLNHGPDGNKGNPSTAFGLTALAGGAGTGYSVGPNQTQHQGGSGAGGPGYGGSPGIHPGADGTLGQGFPGGYGCHWPGTPAGTHYGGGGGGGAGECGYARVGNWPTSYIDDGVTTWDITMKGNASGGDGAASGISGTVTYYAGGGGGGNHGPGNNYGWARNSGGNGGGGHGSYARGNDATYYGGGGGAGSYPGANSPLEQGGAGYQGIIIARHKN